MKNTFASHAYLPKTFASGCWRGKGAGTVFIPTLHYHVLKGPSKELHVLHGPTKECHILYGAK